VKSYGCKAQDRTFADLSKHLYGDAKFSQALFLFNRHMHPENKTFRENPPRLEVGLVILVPPVEILARKYPEVIKELGPMWRQLVEQLRNDPQ
jgi:hypothetical protein